MILSAYQALLEVTLKIPRDLHEALRIAMILPRIFGHIAPRIYPISVVLSHHQKLKLLYAANR
jgi:hypothetical protein